MNDMNPHSLSPEDWKQIIAVPAVREAWGLEDDATPSDFAGTVYAGRLRRQQEPSQLLPLHCFGLCRKSITPIVTQKRVGPTSGKSGISEQMRSCMPAR